MDGPADTPLETASTLPVPDTAKTQIRGSTLLLAGRLLAVGVNFGSHILIVRYLAKADYGAFAYGLSIAALAATIATFGLDRAITRFVPIYDEHRAYDRLFGAVVLVGGTVLSLSLAAVMLVYGLQGALAGSVISDEQAVSLLLILILLAPVQALDHLFTGMFAVFAKPRAIFFRKHVLAPGLRLIVVLLLVLGEAGVDFLAWGYVAAGAVGIAIYSVLLVRELRRGGLLAHLRIGHLDLPAREIFTFTIPLLSSDLLYVVINTSDVLMLEHYRDSTEVADLRSVWPLAHLNQLVLASFALLFTPLAARLFARADREGINNLYWQTAIWMAVFSFPIFAVTFSLAEPVVTTAFGSDYADAATLLSLLSLGYYFNAALGFNGLTLKVFGRLRYIVFINALAAAVNIGVNLILIPLYGALGAAIGTCGTLILHNFLKQYGLRLGTGVNLFQGSYLRVYAGIVICSLVLLVVQLAISPPFLVGLALAAAVSLVVLALGRSSLRVEETFPELRRFRFARLLVGSERRP